MVPPSYYQVTLNSPKSYGITTTSKLGLLGPKRSQSCQFHQNDVFSVVIIGLYDPKQGLHWGYRAQNGVIIRLYGPKTGSKLGLFGPKRCQSCQIHQNCVFSVVIIGL
jgi:hypothetical protein